MNFACIALGFAEMANLRQSTDTADLLVANAFIYTSDPSLPYADSMAVKDGRIVRVGNYSFVQVSPFSLCPIVALFVRSLLAEYSGWKFL